LVLALLAAGCFGNNDLTRAPPAVPTEASAGDLAPAPLASGRLPNTARPTRYELALVVDPQKERFAGDIGISVEIPQKTQAIVLHGRELTILRAEVSANGEHIPATASFRMAAGAKEAPDELVLSATS
jgi:alanyl aminopeptidase